MFRGLKLVLTPALLSLLMLRVRVAEERVGQQQHLKEVITMTWWQSLLMTAGSVVISFVLTALLTGLFNVPKKRRAKEVEEANDVKLCKRGIQVLLKNDLKVRYDYWIDLGYAPEDAKDDLEQEYQVYHSLGKNGVMDSRRAKCLELPTEPPKEHN